MTNDFDGHEADIEFVSDVVIGRRVRNATYLAITTCSWKGLQRLPLYDGFLLGNFTRASLITRG